MIVPGQHRLQRFQLVNWGTFDHYVDMPVPRSGLLITGESGSGKSSLLDAMAAVLVRPAKLRLNAAAQEGGVGDRSRSLLTYVRGAYKREADSDSGEPVTAFLRPGPAWSGICLTFSDGQGKITSLIRLLHAAKSAAAAKDVRSLFIVAEEPVDLLSLEAFVADGLDMRRLKAAFPAWSINSEYSAFAQKMQRRFDLAGDQAQLLLHKTQSAKNLTSLDVLLREFMLDPPETFELADRAIEQFDELSAAHHLVVDARRQTEVLEKLDTHAQQRRELLQRSKRLGEERSHLEAFTLRHTLTETELKFEKLLQESEALENEVRQAEESLDKRRLEQESARRKADGLGARELEILTKEKSLAARQLEQMQAELKRLSESAQKAGLELPGQGLGADDFVAQVRLRLQEAQEDTQARQSRYALAARADQASVARKAIEQQLQVLETQHSALSGKLLNLRRDLAQAADVNLERLAFAGEMISVRPEESRWTGAIERVLRGLAQTLLVPDDLYPFVSDYVDRNHLGQRLVYLRVTHEAPKVDAPSDQRSLVYKITVSEGEFSEWLYAEIIKRFDYLCVQTPAELRAVSRGVSLSGQVKHSKTRHEKDDRSKIDDPSRWVLGSSIETKRQALQTELQRLRREEAEALEARAEGDRNYERQQSLILQLRALLQADWNSLDAAGAQRELDRIQAQIDLMVQKQDGLAQAQAQLKRAGQAVASAESVRDALLDKSSRNKQLLELEQQKKERIVSQLDELGPIPEAVAADLSQRFERLGVLNPEEAGRQMRAEVENALGQATDKLRRVEGSCGAVMGEYKTRWPGPAADLGRDIDFLEEYLALLKNLRADRLPEFESRFFALLQKQSRNNIGTIAQTIARSRREIRLRIDPINRSLAQTEYASGKYLKIKVVDAPPRDVQEFLEDLQTISAGSLEDSMSLELDAEERARAEERFGKLDRLLKRLASVETADLTWRRQCLDTRLHVKFMAEVISAETHAVTDILAGAGGLSGGERQKLVAFCLAAALRYQLAREGSAQPSYGLVILDEAFDKTDPAFTKAGLDVFSAFGFQLLLATPLKMLQTLESYVGGAVQISNREGEGSRCEKLIWEALEDEDQAAEAEPEPKPVQSSLL
ncbi:MAG: ATPase [Coriobacteriia bacterium]|nr:ATPase [Coriobacteriia bacterium]